MMNRKNIAKKAGRSSAAGMTLVEVLFAITLFAIGILAAALMLGNSLSYSASARHMTEASEIAQHKLESLLNMPYHHAELDAAASPHGPVSTGDYSLSWKVAQDVPMPQLKTIRLNVAWKEQGKEKRLVVDAIRQ